LIRHTISERRARGNVRLKDLLVVEKVRLKHVDGAHAKTVGLAEPVASVAKPKQPSNGEDELSKEKRDIDDREGDDGEAGADRVIEYGLGCSEEGKDVVTDGARDEVEERGGGVMPLELDLGRSLGVERERRRRGRRELVGVSVNEVPSGVVEIVQSRHGGGS
jgi:hypothetical protein